MGQFHLAETLVAQHIRERRDRAVGSTVAHCAQALGEVGRARAVGSRQSCLAVANPVRVAAKDGVVDPDAVGL